MKNSLKQLTQPLPSSGESESLNDPYSMRFLPFHPERIAPNEKIVRNFKVNSGNSDAIVLNGNKLCIFPDAYSFLTAGDIQNLVVSFTVVNRLGAELPKIAIFTFRGTTGTPQVSCVDYEATLLSDNNIAFDVLDRA